MPPLRIPLKQLATCVAHEGLELSDISPNDFKADKVQTIFCWIDLT